MIIFASVFCAVTLAILFVQFFSYRQHLKKVEYAKQYTEGR
ncbi:MAG: hypothetical protein PHI31_13070 [Desulfuromonadaceae bacterium]|nr:hypothetical protein [Desulfuromonadaceae bacterium]